jgi:hypothetical protein
VGKYVGTLLTLLVFVAANAGALLLALSALAGKSTLLVAGAGVGSVIAALLAAWRLPRWRTALPVPWALVLLALGWALSSGAFDDRRVVLASALLTLSEVSIVAAIATVFAAFSSPFLTAVFTFSLFIVGRSADTLAHLPPRIFGSAIHQTGELLSQLLPNLMLYVPPRPLLTGEAPGVGLAQYLLLAVAQALAWSIGLLALSSLIFRRRDFL